MESVEIHSRSFLIKWVTAPRRGTIKWQVKPAKKSINFGLYRLTGSATPAEAENGTSTDKSDKNSNASLDDKLAASGLEQVVWVGKYSAGDLHKSEQAVDLAGTYALVFDNTFSKNTAKTVQFSATVVEPGEVELPDIALRKPSLKSSDTGLSTSDESQSQQNTLVSDGRHLSGFMLKKRRKKLQGFAKRWFVLDRKYGVLNYYLDQKSAFMRGSMLVKLCSISAVARTREIIIDSGMEVWHVKALNTAEFEMWIETMDSVRSLHAQRSRPTSSIPAGASGAAVSAAGAGVGGENGGLGGLGYLSSVQGGGSSDEWKEVERLAGRIETALGRIDGGDAAAGTTDARQALNELQGLLAAHHASKHFVGTRSPGNRRSLESVLSNGDDEFYDADETLDGVVFVDAKQSPGISDDDDHDDSDVSASCDDEDQPDDDDAATIDGVTGSSDDLYPLNEDLPPAKRRTDVPPSKSTPPSLIGMLRNNVGKDLTTIAMPVTCNEPVTILQRLSEVVEYSELLNEAAASDNECERLLLLAAFAMSSMSSQRSKERALRKPFNPLLGETFELVREDKGFRFVAEKVSHRPPVMAIQIEARDWMIQYTARPHQKFWGKSAELTDSGPIRITMRRTGETYEYMNPSTFLRNLIAGEKYIEPVGTISIEAPSGAIGTVEFKAGRMFSGRSEAVVVHAVDAKGTAFPRRFEGKWTESLVEIDGSGSRGRTVWQAGPLVPSAKDKYGFTQFTASLNQVTPIEEGRLPPTDSRLRPDQRMYETGDIDGAEKSKLHLEEQQRQRRKAMEERNEQWTPKFFTKSNNGGFYVLRSGSQNYWNRRRRGDWADVPHLW